MKTIRAAFPEYAAMHSPVLHDLHDLLARLDRPAQTLFRRLKVGEKAGLPRYQGCDRWPSCTSLRLPAPPSRGGNDARLDHGLLVLAKRGRIAVRGSRPLDGTPKTVMRKRPAM